LGAALLEHREEGVYTHYGLYDNEPGNIAKQILLNRDPKVFLSPFINQVKFDGKMVIGGTIQEVSLVLARIDPDDAYCPVLKKRSDNA
jgi:hypothetical protein